MINYNQYTKAQRLMDSKEYDEAIDILENLYLMSPQNYYIEFMLAKCYSRRRVKMDTARKLLLKLVEMNPNDPGYLYELAYNELLTLEYDKSKEHFTKVLSLSNFQMQTAFEKLLYIDMQLECYQEAYDLLKYINFEEVGKKSRLELFLKYKLGILTEEDKENTKNKYFLKQMLNYSENAAIEHIGLHKTKKTDWETEAIFLSNINIKKLYREVKQKIRNAEFINGIDCKHTTVTLDYNVGVWNGVYTKDVTVLVFPDSKKIITMFPVLSDEQLKTGGKKQKQELGLTEDEKKLKLAKQNFNHAMYLIKKGEKYYFEAKRILNEILNTPIRPSVLIELAKLENKVKNYEAARMYSKRLLFLNISDNLRNDAYLQLGFAEFKLGNIEEARKHFTNSLALYPKTKNNEALIKLGQLEFDEGNVDAARSYFSKTKLMKSDPDNHQGVVELGLLELNEGNLETAKEILLGNFDSSSVKNIKAAIYLCIRLENYKKAYKYYLMLKEKEDDKQIEFFLKKQLNLLTEEDNQDRYDYVNRQVYEYSKEEAIKQVLKKKKLKCDREALFYEMKEKIESLEPSYCTKVDKYIIKLDFEIIALEGTYDTVEVITIPNTKDILDIVLTHKHNYSKQVVCQKRVL